MKTLISPPRYECSFIQRQGISDQVMHSYFAFFMPGFIVVNLRNSPAVMRNLRLESEHNESHLFSSRLVQSVVV